MTTNPTDLHLELRVHSLTAETLDLGYTLVNPGTDELLVCNLLHRGQLADGGYAVEPTLAYVSFDPGPVPRLVQALPEMGDDVDEEVPVRPFATRVPPGGRIEGRIVVGVPVRPFDAYRSFPPRDPADAVRADRLVVAVGWIAAAEVDPLLLAEVDTALGRLPLVKIAPGAQNIAQAELAVSVPVLPPAAPITSPPRSCGTCGAVNLGDQAACLRCGGPLASPPPVPPPPAPSPAPTPPAPAPQVTPPPAPPAGAAPWRPTHRIPAGGLDGYPTSDRSRPVPIDPGVPVMIIERSGEWARIEASNGWRAWVDGRRLEPLA